MKRDEDAEYLRGWAVRASSLKRCKGPVAVRAGLVLALWAGWPYDPFTEYGAGMADATLVALGLDA